MKRWFLLFKIVIHFLQMPSASISTIVEDVCKNELLKNNNDKYALWTLSNHYVRHKRYKEAELLLESLQNLGKTNKASTLLLGKVYFHLERHRKVVELLYDYKHLSDNGIESYYLGCSLIELRKYNQAISCLKKYTKRNSSNYVGFVKLGYAYHAINAYDMALKAYERSKALNPDQKEIIDSIDICLTKLRNSQSKPVN